MPTRGGFQEQWFALLPCVRKCSRSVKGRLRQGLSPWADGRRLDRARSQCIAYPQCEVLPLHLPSVQDREEWQLQPGRERFLDPLLGSTTASSTHL